MVAHTQLRPRQAPGTTVTVLNALKFLRWDLVDLMEFMFHTYGDIAHLHAPGQDVIFVSNPEYAYEVLIDNVKAFDKMKNAQGKQDGLGLVFGKGLLTNLEHDSWLTQRRMLQPVFHRKHITAISDRMVAAGERMIERWQQDFKPGQQFNLYPEMTVLTLDVVGQTLFTLSMAEVGPKVGPAIDVAAVFAYQRERTPVRIPMGIPTPAHVKFKHAMDEVDDLLYGIIRDRRASSAEYDDLMAMLLAARDEATGEGMDDKQLRDEIITIFGAGHDTTANALSWIWYLLAMHPEVLKKLQDEVDTVLGDRSPSAADLPNLPYTLQVFEEAMRLYPPSPAVPREALEETTIGGYHIPDGAKVLLNIISIHRNPAFWPEPEKFKPERFAPGVNEKRHRFAFMPFGGGPRQCIGNNFALMEGHLLLALMAQHVELKLVPGQDVKREIAITMRPRHGLQVTYHPRQK